MTERVRVREIDDDEGRRLLWIIRRGTGSVVTWRRAQTVLLSARGMPVARIAEVTFTSADRVRDVIHDFNADGFDSFYPKYKAGPPRRSPCSSSARSRRWSAAKSSDGTNTPSMNSSAR
ncbi:helix-turn-helix domain-containing protein [Planomonospora corallina]|uniref:Helix-turn-helix domain-containing protein n=1 Tax=Planomonospora corallina TaxID=1806052 RepID=A0ABV8ID65_9ACTN